MNKDDVMILGIAVLNLPEIPAERRGFIRNNDPANYALTEVLTRTILDGRKHEYRRRGDVEDDPSFKQLIPYVIVENSHGRWLSYYRTKMSGEQRLQGKASIGLGGHIEQTDYNYMDAVWRELHEELGDFADKDPVLPISRLPLPIIGFLYSEDSPVDAVHLGVVHLLKLPTLGLEYVGPNRIENTIGDPLWRSHTATAALDLESWSKLIYADEIKRSSRTARFAEGAD